ncbi:GGDEF and EAL domain-containing protein [Neobacillus niacini]|uniref:GGDEF and EAL domain-containing protein n=1 Tax=Neobacillus niacini TaxID=86668 RepID=UPI0021CB0926|nr:GGDEF and EAL domain-containing protein [Neobacillus niacini]MCM3765119.1 EAL domain-containing protein [Neobacillus niacini]
MILFITIPILVYVLKDLNKKEEAHKHDKQRLRNIYDTLDVAIWSHDLKTNALFITQGIEKLYGYSSEDFYHDKTLWKKVIYPDDMQVIAEREERLAEGEAVTSEYRIIRPGGEVRWILDRGFPTMDDNGKMVFFNSVLFDNTDRKESEGRYRSLVEMSPDIIAVVSLQKVEYINEAGWKLMGATSHKEIIGQSPLRFVPLRIVQKIRTKVGTLNNPRQERVSIEFQVKRLDGKTIDVEMASTPILYEGRFAVQIVGRDITDRKEAEKTIKTMAYYDTLTGLPNRNSFKKHLNDVLTFQKDKMLAVLFLDLDRFKIINDTKGHTVGDLILQKVAHRLELTIRNDGFVSRQGGDEFIILLGDTSKEKVRDKCRQILNQFAKPFEVEGQEFFVTTSIGISLYPDDGIDEESLIKFADTAMYQAKERGKNNYQFYSSNLNGVSVRKMELETCLRKALEKNQFLLHYQPQVSLKTGEIVGIEALIRWQQPESGFISPAEFIPLAEETGLIVPIGKWVLREACKQRKAWSDAGIPDFPIAVNVSVRQFEDEDFIHYISSVLNEFTLDASMLELEITESIMQNLERSFVILNELKELGILLSIDDFGTGYSSLSYLNYLPINRIKIDKSFVNEISNRSSQGALVKTIIDMGLNLNFGVVAEGIETEQQLEFLKKNACDTGQGYFFSRPLPADEVGAMLEKQKTGMPS